MPRICLNYCSLLIAESTKRRALILGSPSFAILQKPRTPRRSFLNRRNCDGMPNQKAYGLKETEKEAGNAHTLFRDVTHKGVEKEKGRLHFSLWSRIDGQRARGARDLVDASAERHPLRTANLEDVLARGIEWRMELEERVGRSAIISPMQCLEYLVIDWHIRLAEVRWREGGEGGKRRTEMMSASRTTVSVSARATTILSLSEVT